MRSAAAPRSSSDRARPPKPVFVPPTGRHVGDVAKAGQKQMVKGVIYYVYITQRQCSEVEFTLMHMLYKVDQSNVECRTIIRIGLRQYYLCQRGHELVRGEEQMSLCTKREAVQRIARESRVCEVVHTRDERGEHLFWRARRDVNVSRLGLDEHEPFAPHFGNSGDDVAALYGNHALRE